MLKLNGIQLKVSAQLLIIESSSAHRVISQQTIYQFIFCLSDPIKKIQT